MKGEKRGRLSKDHENHPGASGAWGGKMHEGAVSGISDQGKETERRHETRGSGGRRKSTSERSAAVRRGEAESQGKSATIRASAKQTTYERMQGVKAEREEAGRKGHGAERRMKGQRQKASASRQGAERWHETRGSGSRRKSTSERSAAVMECGSGKRAAQGL